MSDSIVVNRYAVALFEAVQADNLTDQVRSDFDKLVKVLAFAAPRRLFSNPRISIADKQAVIAGIGERLSLCDPLKRLADLLVVNHRVGLAGAIAARFGELADKASGRERVTITAAIELPKPSRAQVEERLSALVGADAKFRHAVDPDLLGGLIVQVGSRVFDNSVRHHLTQLRQALL